MPELPEVETVKIGLSKLIVGSTILNVDAIWQKSLQASPNDIKQFLIGAKIVEVRRRAKVLIIDLNTQYSLVIHLKMTGQLVYRGEENFGAGHPTDSLIGELPDRSTRIIFGLSSEKGQGEKLFFNDQRKFGWVKLLPTVEIPNIDFFKKVGPEPLSSSFTSKEFLVRVKKRPNSTIKAVLLDQTVLAGVGNIYADESLWGAKIHPSTRVKDIKDESIKNLFKELVFVLKLAIDKGGSTDRNYVNADGKKGSYMDFARVFRRENLPCPRCGNIIEKSRVAGRGTHTCPKCQKI